jgi:hypothetical protein
MYRRADGTYPASIKQIVEALDLPLEEGQGPEDVWSPGDDLPEGWTTIEWDDVKHEHPTLPEYGTPMMLHEEEIWKRCPVDENGEPLSNVYWNWAVGAWESAEQMTEGL